MTDLILDATIGIKVRRDIFSGELVGCIGSQHRRAFRVLNHDPGRDAAVLRIAADSVVGESEVNRQDDG